MDIFLGNNIRFLRKDKELNQSQLAAMVEKGHTTIGNWEKGISEPNIEELTLLSNFFEISLTDLLYIDLSQGHADALRKDEEQHTAQHAPTATLQAPSATFLIDKLLDTKDEVIAGKNDIIAEKNAAIAEKNTTIKNLEKLIDRQNEIIELLKR